MVYSPNIITVPKQDDPFRPINVSKGVLDFVLRATITVDKTDLARSLMFAQLPVVRSQVVKGPKVKLSSLERRRAKLETGKLRIIGGRLIGAHVTDWDEVRARIGRAGL